MESILDMLFNPAKNQRPRRTLIYGVEGIGKSTLGSQFPNAVFMPTEDGLRNIECRSFPMVKTWQEFMDVLQKLAKTPQLPFSQIVIDTADGLDALIQSSVAKDHDKKSLEEIGYGKGYALSADRWRDTLEALEWFNNAKQIGILFLGHCHVEKFTDPAGDSYDRFAPRLHKLASPLLREWCDEVLFATYKVFRSEKDEGFNKKRTIGIDGGRVLKTTEKPSHLAKNRLGLPDELELKFSALAAYYPQAQEGGIPKA